MAEQITTEYPSDVTDNATMNSNVTVCQEAQDIEVVAVLAMLPVAVALTFCLAFISKRKHLKQNCCGGRPGLLYPINFMDTCGSPRWAQCCVFVLLSNRVFNLLEGAYYFKPSAFSDPDFDYKFGWMLVFVRMLNILIICLDFYPLLACIGLRHSIIANIVGLLYLFPWVFFSVIIWGTCPLIPEGDVTHLGAQQFLYDIPILIAYIGLTVTYIRNLVENIRRGCRKGMIDCSIVKFNGSLAFKHKLLETLPPDDAKNVITKVKPKGKFTCVPGFRYSPRLLCTMVVAAMALCKALTVSAVDFSSLYRFLKGEKVKIEKELDLADATGDMGPVKSIEDAALSILSINITGRGTDGIREYVAFIWEWIHITYCCIIVALVLSAIIQFVSMIVICLNYRRHLLELFRGNYEWQPKMIKKKSPAQALLGSLKYSGFQIAFLFNALCLQWILLSILLWLVCYLIIIPIRDGKSNFVLDFLFKLWPTIIVTLVLHYAQLLMCKFFFLQDQGAYMALNNRRAMHIVSYFLFFFNVLLGFFSCFKRILFSIIFGTILISRLDRLLLMKGCERFDSGYSTYLGMLTVDLYHMHPVLKVFVDMVREIQGQHQLSTVTANGYCEDALEMNAELRRKRIIRNKWRKALTLVNNPIIVLDRLQKEIKEKEQKKNKINTQDVADATANTLVSGISIAVASTAAAVADQVGRAVDSAFL